MYEIVVLAKELANASMYSGETIIPSGLEAKQLNSKLHRTLAISTIGSCQLWL